MTTAIRLCKAMGYPGFSVFSFTIELLVAMMLLWIYELVRVSDINV